MLCYSLLNIPAVTLRCNIRHAIIYQRKEPEHKLRIATIKPLE